MAGQTSAMTHDLRPATPDDAGWVLRAHARHYVDGLGFAPGFETVVASALADVLDGHGRGWIAWRGAQRVGCVFCVTTPGGTARLRMFYLAPGARGQGLAQRMFDTVVAHACAAGCARLHVATYAEHAEAGAVYTRNGLSCLRETPVDAFGAARVEQLWEKPLRPG